jgi:hypothetical protein
MPGHERDTREEREVLPLADRLIALSDELEAIARCLEVDTRLESKNDAAVPVVPQAVTDERIEQQVEWQHRLFPHYHWEDISGEEAAKLVEWGCSSNPEISHHQGELRRREIGPWREFYASDIRLRGQEGAMTDDTGKDLLTREWDLAIEDERGRDAGRVIVVVPKSELETALDLLADCRVYSVNLTRTEDRIGAFLRAHGRLEG